MRGQGDGSSSPSAKPPSRHGPRMLARACSCGVNVLPLNPRKANTSVSASSGRLTQKTARQSTSATSSAPVGGPITAEIAHTAALTAKPWRSR